MLIVWSLLRIKGWQTIVGKGSHTAGDEVIYVPIDSVLEAAPRGVSVSGRK